MRPFAGKPQPEWMLKLQVGHVLCSRSGQLRTVRSISRYPTGELSCVTFAIRRCSWTKRCYTVMNYHDLAYQGYSWVQGVRAKMTTELDQKVNAAIRDKEIKLSCSVARGVI